MKEIHIALTGHRPQKLGGWDIDTPAYLTLQKDLERIIDEYIAHDTVVHCHSGLALGADTVWSKAILSARKHYPNNVKFHAEIPMPEQPTKWFRKEDVDFWYEQTSTADFHRVYGELTSAADESSRRRRAAQLLKERNVGMISAADVVIAVHDGSKGGTYHAVNIARKQGKHVIQLDPAKYFA